METERPTRSSRTWAGAVGAVAALVFVLLATGGTGPTMIVLPLLVALAAVVVTGWALVRGRRQRRAHENRVADWAAERATQAERLRIARELHDLVSHGLGLITVRAAVANRAGDDADRAAALADVERVSRETTTELRRMLGVLRTPDAGPVPLRPADTLTDLPAILAPHGATLDLADLGEVSPGGQLTVCAVVREGLANVARHAGPTAAHVSVVRTGRAIVVRVRDDGPAPGWEPRPGAGHGLDGLRERLAAREGALTAEADGAGFVLTARLPDGTGS